MSKQICEVLLSSDGEPRAVAVSNGVSKKRIRKAIKRARKQYHRDIRANPWLKSHEEKT